MHGGWLCPLHPSKSLQLLITRCSVFEVRNAVQFEIFCTVTNVRCGSTCSCMLSELLTKFATYVAVIIIKQKNLVRIRVKNMKSSKVYVYQSVVLAKLAPNITECTALTTKMLRPNELESIQQNHIVNYKKKHKNENNK